MIQAQCAARVAPVMSVSGARKSAFSGKAVSSKSVSLATPRAAKLVVRAADAPAKKAEEKKEEAPWSPPKLNPNTPSPIFGGSTGGLLRKAQVRRGPGRARRGKSMRTSATRVSRPSR
jgi:photosystem I subunit 2